MSLDFLLSYGPSFFISQSLFSDLTQFYGFNTTLEWIFQSRPYWVSRLLYPTVYSITSLAVNKHLEFDLSTAVHAVPFTVFPELADGKAILPVPP